jgi:ubiquinone biosynthesis monooxygenase Coq7
MAGGSKGAKMNTPRSSKKRTARNVRRNRRLPGDASERSLLDRMLRVDHAGEFGAQRIYAGQLAVLGTSAIGSKLRHMAKQENVHLAAFEKLIIAHNVRPTVLHPLWAIAGYALGLITARMGEKAAMACTVAIEETIDEHYKHQLDMLGGREPTLRTLLIKFRNEELEHKQIGLDNGAEDLNYYASLRALIRAGSKTAIWLSERI